MNSTHAFILLLVICLTGCFSSTSDQSAKAPLGTKWEQAKMNCIDLDHLEDELFKHGLASFRRIRSKRPKNTFYCFAFYTDGEFSFAATTASSFEGLDEVARRYKKMDRYKDISLAELKLDLKWSPTDSPLHMECGEELTELSALMTKVEIRIGNLFDTDEKAFESFIVDIEQTFLKALKRIDAEGVFGTGDERKTAIVNLLKGDQSDEKRIEFAKQANLAESVAKMAQEFKVGQDQYMKWFNSKQ